MGLQLKVKVFRISFVRFLLQDAKMIRLYGYNPQLIYSQDLNMFTLKKNGDILFHCLKLRKYQNKLTITSPNGFLMVPPVGRAFMGNCMVTVLDKSK